MTICPNEVVRPPLAPDKLKRTFNVARAAGTLNRIHSKQEASRLVHDAELHAWLRKRQKATAPAKPRTFMSRHRRSHLLKVFESIDRDGSGQIDQGEFSFALAQLGLPASHVAELFDEGDADNDGFVSRDEFLTLVINVSAREHAKTNPTSHRGDVPAHVEGSAKLKAKRREAAASLATLIDRAADIPIGLLANAQMISNLGA